MADCICYHPDLFGGYSPMIVGELGVFDCPACGESDADYHTDEDGNFCAYCFEYSEWFYG